MTTIVDHWPLALAVGGVVLLLGAALWHHFGPQVRYVARVARALAGDRRLPRPLRWLFRAGLVIKAIPGPDLGVDEVLLVAATCWLLLRHRTVLRAILAEAH